MPMFLIPAALIAGVLGAVAGRLHGGWARVAMNKTVGRALIALLVMAAAWPLLGESPADDRTRALTLLLVGVIAYIGVALPHGSGIDLATSARDDPDELRRDLWAPEDTVGQDLRFLVVQGSVVTLGLALPLAPLAAGGALPAGWLALAVSGGPVKAAAYWTARRFRKPADGRLRWVTSPTRDGPLWRWPDLAEALHYGTLCALVQALWLAV